MKLYLLGVLIAFIIELLTMIRIKDFCFWGWMRALIFPLFSWLWIIFFLSWVYDMMGWDYDLDNADPYEFMAWRLKQRCEE